MCQSSGTPNNQTRILLVCSKFPPEYSGSGNRAQATYLRLQRKYNISYDVLCSSITSNHNYRYTLEGVDVYRVARKPFSSSRGLGRTFGRLGQTVNYWSEVLSVFSFLWGRRRQYAAFHIFGNVDVTSGVVSFAKIFDIPFLLELTSAGAVPHQSESRIFRWLAGPKLPDASRLVCISKKLAQVCERYGYGPEAIWCRPNPVNEAKFNYDPDDRLKYRRLHTDFTEDDIVLCYIGKFMPSKNQLFLVEMLQYLPREYKLILVGPVVREGPLLDRDRNYLDSVNQSIKRLNIGQRVKVIPEFTPHPEEYMKLSDVYAFPSTSEGLGTPVLEAIACGVPVVANRLKDITDTWITDGENGFLSTLNFEEFAHKVRQAVGISPSQMRTSSEKILRVASSQAIDQKYYMLMKEIVSTKHNPPNVQER